MRTIPRFHEDMNVRSDDNINKLKTVEHFLRNKQKPIDPKLSGTETTTSSTEQTFRNFKNDNNATPLKNRNFGTNMNIEYIYK